jgi:hypothetical protein
MSDLDARPVIYAEVGANYRAIDDLRLRLLGLLPLATGTGIFLLLGSGTMPPLVLAVSGVLGIFATISFFFYELHGVEKCAHFIHRGQQLEESMGVPGSFTRRPHQIFRVVSELLPSQFVYPASFAGWTYVALTALPDRVLGLSDDTVAVGGSALALLVAICGAHVLVKKRERAREALWKAEDATLARGNWPRPFSNAV